ncbi:MAG: O-antigen ligase family protein [Candidatus Thiodiazotropha sp.]
MFRGPRRTPFAPLITDMSDNSRWYSAMEWIGFAGLTLFCFFSLLGTAGASLGLALMLLALLLSPEAWRRLPRHSLFWAAVLSIAYLLASRYILTAGLAGDMDIRNNQTRDWVQIFLFPVTGWWISRHPGRYLYWLGLMLGGFTLGILHSLWEMDLSGLLGGIRTGMHFGKPVIFGFVCAVAILAMFTLSAFWLNPRLEFSRTRRALSLGATLLMLLFYAQGLVFSQSRGVWLALLVTLPVVSAILWHGLKAGQVVDKRRWGWAGLVAIMLVASAVAFNWKIITERVAYENEVFGVVLSEGLDEAPLDSSTYRLHLWRFGIRRWLERPLFGWGPGMTESLVETENTEALKHDGKESFDHLHNAYLELLLQLGLVGMCFVSWLAALMVVCLVRHFRRRDVSVYWFSFLMGNFVLIAVYSLTDFRHLHWNWRFYWLILAGIVFAQCIVMPQKRGGEQSPE